MTHATAAAKPGKFRTKHLMAVFGVGHVTLNNWRKTKEEGNRRDPLPGIETWDGNRRIVSFNESDVKAWAKANGVSLAKTFKEAFEEVGDTAGKPGPKVTSPRPALKKSPQKATGAKSAPLKVAGKTAKVKVAQKPPRSTPVNRKVEVAPQATA